VDLPEDGWLKKKVEILFNKSNLMGALIKKNKYLMM
jgi:hypothetical protein